MNDKCLFCDGTRKEEGQPGCVWCDETGRTNGLDVKALCECNQGRLPCTCKSVTRYNTVQLRFATGDLAKAEYVDARLFDELKADRDSLSTQLDQCQARRRQFCEEVTARMNVLDERADGLEQRIARLRHVGMELTGVIDEYRAMPCDSLKVRMFQTADRYRKRLNAKCSNCEDYGVIGYTTGQTPESFD